MSIILHCIVSIIIIAKALSLTLALFGQLKTALSNLVVALNLISHVPAVVRKMHSSGFHEIFEAALSVVEGVRVEMEMTLVST